MSVKQSQSMNETHLWWDGKTGKAIHLGASLELTEPPKLSTVHRLAMINYRPLAHDAVLRESARSERPMTPIEIDEAQILLDSLVAEGRRIFNQDAAVKSAKPDPICVQAWRALSTAISELPERHDLVSCLKLQGVPRADILALLERLRTDGERAIETAIGAARPAPPPKEKK